MSPDADKDFENREAIQHLLEDNELASIEALVAMRRSSALLAIDEKFDGMRAGETPALMLDYLGGILARRHVAELEFIRARTNRNYLRGKARELWR